MIRAVRLFTPANFLPLLIFDTFWICACFYPMAFLTLEMDPSLYFLEERGMLRLIPVVIVMLLTMYLADLYDRNRVRSRLYLLQQLCLVAGVALLSQAFISYLDERWIVPKDLMLASTILSAAVLFVWRLFYAAASSKLLGAHRVLILGTNPTVKLIANHIAHHPEMNLAIAGSLTRDTAGAIQPVLGDVGDLKAAARRIKPFMIIAGLSDTRERLPIADMVDLRFAGATLEEAGAAYELICRRICARDLRPSRALFSRDFDGSEESTLVKLADRLLALFLLLVCLPVILVCALVIRVQTGDPPITREICAGFKGRPLISYQLRIPDRGWLSAVARKLPLEQFPQLWNVLIGRMSMVGPRPERAEIAAELTRMIPVYECRQNVKPGITGWAQLHARNDEPVHDTLKEFEYDLYYVKNHAPSLYAFILLNGIKKASL